MPPLSREDDGLVLRGTSEHIIMTSLGEAFNEHLYHFTHFSLIALERKGVLQGDDLVQAADLLLLADVVRQMFLRVRPGSFRVLEHERRVEAHFAHQAERLSVVLKRLVVKTAEHVRTDSCLRNDTPDGGYTFEVPLAGVLAVHEFENLVAAALHRQMDELADVTVGSYDLQRFVAHVFGVGGGEANAHVRHGVCNYLQQISEINNPTFFLPSVGVDVLSEQGHLFIATCLQVEYFVADAFYIARALPSAGVRHNAVGAEVVAATHDANEAGYLLADTCREDVSVSLGSAELYVDGLMSLFALGDEIRQVKICIRPGYKVHMVVTQEFLAHALGHTTNHANHSALVVFASGEFLQAVLYTLLGVIADGAGVQNNDVCMTELISQFGISGLENSCHHLAVRHVHLASVGLYVECFVHEIKRMKRLDHQPVGFGGNGSVGLKETVKERYVIEA